MKGQSSMGRNVGILAERAGGMLKLAEVLGVSKQTVYLWSRGTVPGITHQAKVKELFGFEYSIERGVFDTPEGVERLNVCPCCGQRKGEM